MLCVVCCVLSVCLLFAVLTDARCSLVVVCCNVFVVCCLLVVCCVSLLIVVSCVRRWCPLSVVRRLLSVV